MLKVAVSKIEISFLFIFVLIIAIATYLHTNHPKPLKQALYTFQYPFAFRTIKCSVDSPKFMYKIMSRAVKNQKSMSNQLVYLDVDGTTHNCVSGWKDGFLGTSKLDNQTRFRFASITKVLTAEIILQLIEEGKLSLDSRLVDVLEMDPTKFQDSRMNDITIEMLLQHSAGFDRFKTATPMFKFDTKPWCPTNIEELYFTELNFQPNTQFQYSNLGYCLLEASVVKIEGDEFKNVAMKRLKLNKYNIKFATDQYFSDEVKYDFRFESFLGEWYLTKLDFNESLTGVAGLSGSAESLLKLISDINKHSKSIDIQSRSKTPCAIGTIDACYGYAMQLYQVNGSQLVFFNKSGSLPGVETDLFLDSNGGILVFFRAATAPSFETTNNLRRMIFSDLDLFYSQHK